MERTYWNNQGKYQNLADELHQKVPKCGEVHFKEVFPALEKYRIACNAYYDLFNNGLFNRAKEFRKIFGFGGTKIAKEGFPICQKLENKMDEIILAAAKEVRLIQ